MHCELKGHTECELSVLRDFFFLTVASIVQTRVANWHYVEFYYELDASLLKNGRDKKKKFTNRVIHWLSRNSIFDIFFLLILYV